MTNDGPGVTYLISQPVTECQSGICLGPAADSAPGGTNTGPLCSAPCASNDDCSNSEGASASDPSDTRCKTGFVCMWPTTVGRLACQQLCVCRDLVVEPQGGFTKPVVCP